MLRHKQLLSYNPAQQLLSIVKQLPRGHADGRIVKNLGVFAPQLPGLKERRPVDIGHQLR
jgi:hypothetical protein